MKRIKNVLLLFCMLVVLVGCASQGNDAVSEQDLSAFEKIQQKLTELQTFQTNATVEYISNKGSNVYSVIKRGKITGEYRIDVVGPEAVAGNVTIFDGTMIYQYNPRVAGKVVISTTESRDRYEILITSFIRNYLKSQEVSISVANMDEGRRTILEAPLPGNHAYLATSKLWIDNDTLTPVQLIIYDPEGSERIIVTFSNFEYNIELEDTLFRIEQ